VRNALAEATLAPLYVSLRLNVINFWLVV